MQQSTMSYSMFDSIEGFQLSDSSQKELNTLKSSPKYTKYLPHIAVCLKFECNACQFLSNELLSIVQHLDEFNCHKDGQQVSLSSGKSKSTSSTSQSSGSRTPSRNLVSQKCAESNEGNSDKVKGVRKFPLEVPSPELTFEIRNVAIGKRSEHSEAMTDPLILECTTDSTHTPAYNTRIRTGAKSPRYSYRNIKRWEEEKKATKEDGSNTTIVKSNPKVVEKVQPEPGSSDTPVKRGRGRPRKKQLIVEEPNKTDKSGVSKIEVPEKEKQGEDKPRLRQRELASSDEEGKTGKKCTENGDLNTTSADQTVTDVGNTCDISAPYTVEDKLIEKITGQSQAGQMEDISINCVAEDHEEKHSPNHDNSKEKVTSDKTDHNRTLSGQGVAGDHEKKIKSDQDNSTEKADKVKTVKCNKIGLNCSQLRKGEGSHPSGNMKPKTRLKKVTTNQAVEPDKEQRRRGVVTPHKSHLDENTKAKTCAICGSQMESILECFKHYEQVHNFVAIPDKKPEIVKPDPVIKEAGQGEDEPEKERKDAGSESMCRKNTEVCVYCGKFYSKTVIYRHIHLSHIWRKYRRKKERNRTVLCDICGKVFTYTQNLSTHKRIHRGLKRRKNSGKRVNQPVFNCKLCDFKTYENRRLKDHISGVHEGEFPYKCNHCEYQTWERNSFRSHQFRHQIAKRYSCELCPYQCIQRPQLREHMKRHHDVLLPKTGKTLDIYKNRMENSGSQPQPSSAIRRFPVKRQRISMNNPAAPKIKRATQPCNTVNKQSQPYSGGYELEVHPTTLSQLQYLYPQVAGSDPNQQASGQQQTYQIVTSDSDLINFAQKDQQIEIHMLADGDNIASLLAPSGGEDHNQGLLSLEHDVAEALIQINPDPGDYAQLTDGVHNVVMLTDEEVTTVVTLVQQEDLQT